MTTLRALSLSAVSRGLAWSVVVTWPALLVADELPQDGALNGKADDLVTSFIVVGLLIGLFAAGWLRPLWVVVLAVVVLAVVVPVLFEAVGPSTCRVDCVPALYAAAFVVPGLLVVLLGWCARRATGSSPIDALPR